MTLFMLISLLLSVTALSNEEFHFVNTKDGPAISELDAPPAHLPNMVWALDPFEKLPGLSAQDENEEDFQLEGTLASDRSPAAIIDDQVVGVGEEIGSRKLRRVGPNFVLLEKGGSVIEIPIKKKERAPASRSASTGKSADPVKEPVLQIEEIKE